MTFFLSLFFGIGKFVWAGIKWVIANPKVIPYLVIAVLAGGLYIEHAKLLRSQRETATTRTSLQTAVAANRSDVATIAALQKGVANLESSLGQEHAAAVVASAKSSQITRALSQQLAAAQQSLQQLELNPTYEAYLSIDLNTQYPDLARSLRALDAVSQD